jgi:cytochrome b subunit of formate dehydrogenase
VSSTVEATEAGSQAHQPHVVVRRFSAWGRATHAVLAASVFGLVLTGMPLRYPGAFWAKMLLAIWQGDEGAALLHRVFAVGFFLAGAMHVAGLVIASITGRFRWRSVLEPDSILLRPQDARNLVSNLRYLRGQGPKPEFGRFTYWEKFDYFAEIWGLLVIGLSGLVMWFPVTAARYLPGWVVNAALIFHAYEALLAMGFLFAIHFFNTHLRPDVFPVDPVIFSGNIPLEEVRHRYPGWYKRLSQQGAGFVPSRADPSQAAVVISVAYLTIGLVTLTFVMIDAVLEAWNYLNVMF